MEQATTIGLDLAKNVLQVHGISAAGQVVLRRKLRRGAVLEFFAALPPALVGMEACVGAHHLSRRLKSLGHDARLMPAKYVWPYNKGQKNDFRDAEAIAEPWLPTTRRPPIVRLEARTIPSSQEPAR